MGQCLSFAKAAAPIVEDIVEDALKASQAEAAASGGGGGSTTAPSGSAAAPQSQAPTSWAAVAGAGGGSSPAPAPAPVPVTPSKPTTAAGGRSGAVHSSLPSGAEQHRVRNVYDGDTLTLTDERRVRLLGIDTPEIKEQQPYAQEAKAYTKDRCDKSDIWISYEPGGEKEDHYGRLLAFVWVESDGGYLCINEGIVEAGYARAYHPGKGKKLGNWNRMLELQSAARAAKRGVWEDFEDFKVVKTANGSAYHKRSCEHLASVRNLTEMWASEASEKGLHPCRTCMNTV